MNNYDLAIIGAGPVGLFASSFAKLHGLKTITFEALSKVGGQVQWLYPQKNIHDIAGYNTITGSSLIDNLNQQASDETFITNHKVKTIERKENDTFLIDDTYLVKSIIIASGLGAFRPKKFPLQLDEKTQKHFHYFMTNPDNFSNKNIAIFGGGDSALDWAIQLSKKSNVSIIHRRDKFRGLETSIEKLKSLKNIEFLIPYLPKEAAFEDNQLVLTLKAVGEDKLVKKRFDEALIAYGFRSDNLQLRKWGLELENGLLKVNRTMQTNLKGIYAIGDTTTYPGRVPMIALGFGEAQIAVTSIMNDLFPEKKMTLHSTSI
ncbi:NAD(P)/FAD-dependent oxidoreductase [Lactobacillus sp.]|uniref:NAD(P)/FAD-dependent oxidoreductase n=1 Tax=Lactobacillus sp. TaxID=1591 RepID=UPI0019B35561|nr:NAD(P)/FAD-dependent oxidoreductase [Lactobacillus sp.]MBD5429949.1 NAD(P)/FAD-dependent oxidoreductase [Lactobacillus sp.]